jgi:hypothetical protein
VQPCLSLNFVIQSRVHVCINLHSVVACKYKYKSNTEILHTVVEASTSNNDISY